MATAVPATPSTLDLAVRIHTRMAHPAGSFDKAGRWYPTTECPCCRAIRTPSRAWPYSLLTHCRSVAHLAAEYGIEAKTLRKAIKATRTA